MNLSLVVRLVHAPATIAAILLMTAHTALAERYALLAGNSTAQGDYAELKYVRNDLSTLKDILTDFCGFDKTRILTVYNSTPEELDRSIAALAGRMSGGSGDMFLFYYSGHADQTCLRMGGSEYRLDTLKKKLTDFPSDIRIGVFDACQSGSFTRIKGGKLDEPFLFRDDGRTKGQVILCSSSTDENAQESDALGNSIFTFHIVNALRGSGDQSGDGRVTLSEAYQYAYNHTLSSTAGSAGGVQHPSYQFRIQGEGDIVLADLNVSSRGILLGPDVTGAVTILNAGNVVVADLTKEKNSGVMIALAPGDYGIINGRGEVRYRAAVTVAERKIVTMRRADFATMKNETGRKKGDGRKGFRFGIGVGGRVAQYDMSKTAASLDSRFVSYRLFAMDPRFSFAKTVGTPQVTFELSYAGLFAGHLGICWYSGASEADFSGYQTDFAGNRYSTRLHIGKKLRLTAVDLGAGYRCPYSIGLNVRLLAGLSWHTVDLTVSSAFSDSLYDAESHGSGHVQGTAVIPYVALGYEVPLTKMIGIGSNIRYRFQKAAREIDGLDFNFGGPDGNLYIKINFPGYPAE